MQFDHSVVPIFRGTSQKPQTFAKVDDHLLNDLGNFRWLLRPGTHGGFTCRTFVDQQPIGLHQMIYIHNMPNVSIEEWNSIIYTLSSVGMTGSIRQLQHQLPKITFNNSDGLDCRYHNLHFVARSYPGLPFPADDPMDSDHVSEVELQKDKLVSETLGVKTPISHDKVRDTINDLLFPQDEKDGEQ